MTAPPQQQLTPGDHQYFEWSTSKQQTNLRHPLMAQTHRSNYYQHYEDNQFQPNKTTIPSPSSHIKKKQRINGIESNDQMNHTCYPFQAELTQKIDIECDGGNTNNGSNQTIHPPTHHFTLSTVINVSVNGQTQKSLDILPSPSQQPYPIKSHEHLQSFPTLIPYSELSLSLYLKDIDLTTLDTFILPSCPNPQDYLTVDGLLTFLMSDKQSSMQQMSHYSRTPQYRYPYQQYSQLNPTGSCVSSPMMEIGPSAYYRQSSLPQQMTKYYSTATSTPLFR